jgi:hypothetical protein
LALYAEILQRTVLAPAATHRDRQRDGEADG